MKAKSIEGATFWKELEPDIKAGGGFAHFNDGDLQYAAMQASSKMVIVQRTAKEFFSTTVARESAKLGLKVVINANYFDLTSFGYAHVFTSNDPEEASYTVSVGQVISAGAIFGTPDPKRFYFGQKQVPVPLPKISEI